MQLRGHHPIIDRFRRALSRGRLASTFLFVGPPGIGKRTFALQLASALLCERHPEERLEPCGACPSCHQVAALTHPDLQIVARPADKAFIPVELLIGDAEHRMRAGLCYNIALKPYSGRRKIAIIDDADHLNKEGANCLLKTLEEPPPRSLLILIGTSEQRQLPTIRSRCQVVRFQPLIERDVADLLLAQRICDDPQIAKAAAAHSEGSLERGRQWCDEGLILFRRELLSILRQEEFELQPAAKLLSQFVDDAGKESAAKRQRLRVIVSLAEEFFRAALWKVEADVAPVDPEIAQAMGLVLPWMSAAAPAACLEICLEAAAHLDANVNQATFIDWWLNELSTAAKTKLAAA